MGEQLYIVDVQDTMLVDSGGNWRVSFVMRGRRAGGTVDVRASGA